MDWIILAQGRDKWQVLVHTVINLRVASKAGILLTNWETVSEEGLFSMKLVSQSVSQSVRHIVEGPNVPPRRFVSASGFDSDKV
jgi:hypothetical protein